MRRSTLQMCAGYDVDNQDQRVINAMCDMVIDLIGIPGVECTAHAEVDEDGRGFFMVYVGMPDDLLLVRKPAGNRASHMTGLQRTHWARQVSSAWATRYSAPPPVGSGGNRPSRPMGEPEPPVVGRFNPSNAFSR